MGIFEKFLGDSQENKPSVEEQIAAKEKRMEEIKDQANNFEWTHDDRNLLSQLEAEVNELKGEGKPEVDRAA